MKDMDGTIEFRLEIAGRVHVDIMGKQLYGDVIITVMDKTGCLSRDTMVLGERLILGSGCGIHSAK
ncbi:hypothetical protein [Dorea sp.]|uniref:hypothetical protein n=2 Tax=Dorea TaxID=189330 RepID=UPI0035278469